MNNYYLEQEGTAYSAFAQLIFNLTDTIELDVGGRYSYEEKKLPVVLDGGGISEEGASGFPGTRCNAVFSDADIVNPTVDEADWDDFSPEVTLSYRPSSDLTWFASYKKGFLSGGFNSSSVNFETFPDLSYDPQEIEGFEVGVHSALAGGALTLNGAVYYYEVTDLQVTNFVNATNAIVNAGEVEIQGVELDVNYQTPLEGFRCMVRSPTTMVSTRVSRTRPATTARRRRRDASSQTSERVLAANAGPRWHRADPRAGVEREWWLCLRHAARR